VAVTPETNNAHASRPNLEVAEVVFDCVAHEDAVAFWTAALGYERGWAAGAFAQIHDPTGRQLPILFQRVPEGKIVKNRVHLDLRSPDMAAEVERLTGLGGRRVREVEELGAHWTVMVDPDGNEFCVVSRKLKE
jgi:predicted enzyme related to lactoylglutathione lyase